MVVDVGEIAIERPKKKQKRYYSGKQKRHTLKAQLLVEFETGQIISTAVDTGKTHDLNRYSNAVACRLSPRNCV